MRKNLLLCAFLASFAAIGHASFQFGNNPDLTTPDLGGWFSDDLASNGTGFWARSRAETVTLTGAPAFSVQSITFWGYSEGFVSTDIDNVSGFEVNVFSVDGSNLPDTNLASFTVTKAEANPNNLFTLGSGPLFYEFTISGLDIELTEGTYAFNIGAQLVDSQNGDGWAWHYAEPGADDNLFLQTDTNVGWGNWEELVLEDLAINVEAEAVPEPATLALLAGLPLLARKRRKN